MGVLRATAESRVFTASESTPVAGLGAGGLEGAGALGGADDLAGVDELAAGVDGLAGAGGLAGGDGGDVGLETLGRTAPSSVGSSSAFEGFPGTSGSRGLPELAIISSKKPSSAEVGSLPLLNWPVQRL